MLLHCFNLIAALPYLGWQLVKALPAEGWKHVWKRLPLFIVLFSLVSISNLLHVFGFLLDEIIFPNYRKTKVSKPVFIIGIPRSGTTFLQRVLAKDQRFTTFTTWEALLAPSITERYLYSLVGFLLRPFGLVLTFFRKRLFRQMDGIHIIRLNEAEEDFLLLIAVNACLLLSFVCPESKHYKNLARFDQTFPEPYKKKIMAYYRFCLQKHIHFSDPYQAGKVRLLSKNPSFTPMLKSLQQEFSDGFFLACTREPLATIPSTLSSLRPAKTLLASGEISDNLSNFMVGVLHHYYSIVRLNSNCMLTIEMSSLKMEFITTLELIYCYIGLDMNADLLVLFEQENNKAKQYQSTHRYVLNDFNLKEDQIRTMFSEVWGT